MARSAETTHATDAGVAASFEEHRRLLWGLAYRMTGSAADADDVVQDAFERATLHPPPRADLPLRPWLVRVVVNLARDVLRQRKVRGYVGPWLPSPVEDDGWDAGAAAPDARYELRESASYAFLLALEALTPGQRGVLLLRDVLDYSVRETARALALSEGNVKVVHHRARAAMKAYDKDRPCRAPSPEVEGKTRAALERFLTALLAEDAAAAEACLSDGACLWSDGGGEMRAALRPVVGKNRVQRFFFGLQKKHGMASRLTVRTYNGLPAVVAEYDAIPAGWGRRFLVRCDVGLDGAIDALHIVVAPRKMTHVTPV